MNSIIANDGDAFAPRLTFLSALREAVARYSEATGTRADIAAVIGGAYLQDHALELRAPAPPEVACDSMT
ncbi:MAG TPA: hypothetical protein VMB73_25550 [Acetobacteraceae bacterium]|nr:hypothetical protein [Acetobacteraceae bacterium]